MLWVITILNNAKLLENLLIFMENHLHVPSKKIREEKLCRIRSESHEEIRVFLKKINEEKQKKYRL